jgi:sugar lactone lactonase YvrE
MEINPSSRKCHSPDVRPGDLPNLTKTAPAKIAGGFGSVRGPVFSRADYLLFCDTQVRRIVKWEQGKISVLRENTAAGGLTFDHQGRLLTCERGRVTRAEKNGTTTVLAAHARTPQDLVYAIDGSVYFSDAGP